MSLVTQQRDLLRLLQGDDPAAVPAVADDPYLAAVAGTEALDIVREIGLWWREFGVEQWCALTSALLKQRGTFSETVARFSVIEGLSRYIEEVGVRFLAAMGDHPDPLVAGVARFEAALIRAARGDATVSVIHWDRDPAEVVASLVEGRPVADAPTGAYRTRVSADLPQLFVVEPA
jgi:hypothetical protein